MMRTTLTLDDEVAVGLKQMQQRHPEKTFKDIVNDVMKKGLAVNGERTKVQFKVRTGDAVPKPGLNFDNINALLSIVEGDDRKW